MSSVTYACEKCDFQDKKEYILKRHIESKHQDAKYSCDHCDYQIEDQNELRAHFKSNHEGVKRMKMNPPDLQKNKINRHEQRFKRHREDNSPDESRSKKQ